MCCTPCSHSCKRCCKHQRRRGVAAPAALLALALDDPGRPLRVGVAKLGIVPNLLGLPAFDLVALTDRQDRMAPDVRALEVRVVAVADLGDQLADKGVV